MPQVQVMTPERIPEYGRASVEYDTVRCKRCAWQADTNDDQNFHTIESVWEGHTEESCDWWINFWTKRGRVWNGEDWE